MSAEDSSPQPTADDLEHVDLDDDGRAADGLPVGDFLECDATRRNVLRGLGAAGAAGLASGTAAADDEDDGDDGEEYEYDPEGDVPRASASVGRTGIGRGYSDLEDEISDPDADETVLHSTAVSERESYDFHLDVFENHLMDMDTIASLEARDEIGQAWEDGETAEDTYIERVLPRIREYFTDPHEINHLEITNKAFAQFTEIAETAAADTDVNDDFLAVFVENDHPDENLEYATFGFNDDDEFGEGTVELHNGDEHTIEQVPMLHIYTESGDGEFHGPWTDVLGTYDPDEERFEVEADDGSHTWSTSLNVNVQSVGDPDDGGLESQAVFWGSEFADVLEEIEDTSDQVTGNYDEDLVDDLFAEMDEGNLDPSDVRGAEGNARFLAGTGDLSEDALRIALLQQFNLDQPNLSNVASMTADFDGFTDRTTLTDDDGRFGSLPADKTDATLEGLPFTRAAPTDGFQPDETYATGIHLYAGADDGTLHTVDPTDGSLGWSDPTASDPVERVAVSDTGRSVAYVEANDWSYLHTVHNGHDTRLDVGESDSYFSVGFADDTVLLGGRDELRAWDLTEVEESEPEPDWKYDGREVRIRLADSPDGDVVYGYDNDDYVFALDAADGSVLWETAPDHNIGSTREGFLSRDGETMYMAGVDGQVAAFDLTDEGSLKWIESVMPDDGFHDAALYNSPLHVQN